MKTRVIAWWSGGIASALATYHALQIFKNVDIVFIDTKNEHPDTYRFLTDCQRLYSMPIKTISNPNYTSIQEVWMKKQSLNVATGAICSTELKRVVRENYQDYKIDFAQIFGFDINEMKRHTNMRRNYPELNVISPLIDAGLTKAGIVREWQKLGIEIPEPYRLGYRNNNCFKTGCVQGGIGYWQKIKNEDYHKFVRMAEMEHELTDQKGKPVTILKDQSKDGGLVFLMPHEDYPDVKDISMMKGRKVEPLIECTGFCSTKD